MGLAVLFGKTQESESSSSPSLESIQASLQPTAQMLNSDSDWLNHPPAEIEFLTNHEIREGDSTRPVVMMTYDDNAKYDQVCTILDAFNKRDARATFFFIGEKVELSSKAVKAIVNVGHILGCHSWNHTDLGTQTDDEINQSIRRCFAAVEQVVPGYRMKFIRFPYGLGAGNPRLLRIAAQWGLQHVYWSFGSGGLDSNTYETVMRNAHNGAIVLSHMFRPYDVSQAGRIVNSLVSMGYSLETVETGRKPNDDYGS